MSSTVCFPIALTSSSSAAALPAVRSRIKAQIGITDAVLCERKQVTSGTTWHAAGLVTQLGATRNMTECEYTGELFDQLEI